MKNPFRRPSALTLAVHQLEATRVMILDHEGLSEYHVAMARMLHARALRLSAAVQDLSTDPEQPKPFSTALRDAP